MQGKIFYGGQMEARCPHMEIGLRKFAGMGWQKTATAAPVRQAIAFCLM